MTSPRTLVLAWGNPGRGDDGLGPAFAARLAAEALPEVTVETDYQLQVEFAADVARHDRILFVDADRSPDSSPWWIERLHPATGGASFSTHSVAPGEVLALGRELFDAEPEAWLVGIHGYQFDALGEGLSPGARANLEAALAGLRAFVAGGPPGGDDPVRPPAQPPP